MVSLNVVLTNHQSSQTALKWKSSIVGYITPSLSRYLIDSLENENEQGN